MLLVFDHLAPVYRKHSAAIVYILYIDTLLTAFQTFHVLWSFTELKPFLLLCQSQFWFYGLGLDAAHALDIKEILVLWTCIGKTVCSHCLMFTGALLLFKYATTFIPAFNDKRKANLHSSCPWNSIWTKLNFKPGFSMEILLSLTYYFWNIQMIWNDSM